MAGKALNGKPYAGIPPVRFDEGKVASAATPSRGTLLNDYSGTFARRGLRRFAAFALSALALSASANNMFTNSFGYWGDASNWSDGVVPNSPSESVQIEKAAHVTNDVDGLVVSKIYNMGEAHVYGKPISLLGMRALDASAKTGHYHCPIIATNGLVKLGENALHLYATNDLSSLSGPGTTVFHVDEPATVATNWSFAPFVYSKPANENSTLALYGTAQSRPVQGILSYSSLGFGRLTTDSYSRWRLDEFSSQGHVVVDGYGSVEVGRSQGNIGAWTIAGAELHFPAGAPGTKPASAPDLHLDASRADLFEYLGGDPANGVVRWKGVNGHGYAYHDMQEAADGTRVLPMRVENSANGLAVVDFGDTYNKGYSPATERAKGGYLILDKGAATDYAAWTIFIVECCQNFPWGASHASEIMHGTDAWNGSLAANRGETHADFKDGSALIRLNGADATINSKLSGKGTYDVLGVRMANSNTWIGRLAWDRTYRTGAARIAEVLVYTRKLTDDEFASTEAYLLKKWKGIDVAAPRLPDHEARAVYFSSSSSPKIVVEDGTELRAGEVGGIWSGGLSGGGRLESRVMPGQVAPFEAAGGVIAPATGGAALPAPAADPVAGAFFHLDATRADTFTLGPGGEVLEWRDVDYATSGRAAYSPNDAVNPPPHRVAAALNGLPAVDSGSSDSGQALLWNHTNTTIQCLFLVYARPGGDKSEFIVGDTYRSNTAHFHRGANCEMFYPSGYVAPGITSASATIRVNGTKTLDYRGCYLPPTKPAVIAINLAEGKPASAAAFFVDRWGHPSNGYKFRSGAQTLCEAVFYDRRLDDDEFAAVEAHLIAKWLPKTPAAFAAKPGEEIFGELKSTADDPAPAIDVPSGASATVGPLLGKSWRKTGGGTLTVNGIPALEGTLELAEGELALGARELTDGWRPPAGTFHVDADDASSFALSGDAVLGVRDTDGGAMSAYAPTNNGTVLSPRRVARADLGGKCAIDFGEFGSSDGTYGDCLLWTRRDAAIRTVFLVVNAERGFGMPLGSSTAADGNDFRRQTGASTSPIWDGNSSGAVRSGRIFIDGVQTVASASFPAGWHVLSFQTTDSCRASAFAADMYDTNGDVPARLERMGGVLLAEAVVYDSLLESSLRRDIEAYLMRKWMGAAPSGYAGGSAAVDVLATGDGSLSLPEGTSLAAKALVGTNDFALASAATVAVEDLSAFKGTFAASGGTIKVTGLIRTDVETVPAEGLIAHFDMAATNLLETYEENGTNFVTKWYDRSGQRYAVADPTNRPWIAKGDCNGLDVLCTGPFCQLGRDTMANMPRAGWLTWDKSDCKAKTVIEVIGLQEGGNFLVCCSPGSPCIHRGGNTGRSYADSILAGDRTEPGESLYSADAFFSINGDRVPYTQGFPSASYHSFAARVDGTKEPGYFYIGQFGKDRIYRWGGQRICEVIAYDRCLTDDELGRLEAYLQAKWFGRQYRNYVADGLAAIELSDGAALDLGGETRTASTVSGSGVVSNGTLRVSGTLAPAGLAVEGDLEFVDGATLAVDSASSAAPLAVSGNVKFGAAGTLSISVPPAMRGREVALFTASSVENVPKDWNLAASPALPEGFGWRVRFADGTLWFKTLNQGLVIQFR